MTSKVAIVDTGDNVSSSFKDALEKIGGIRTLNSTKKETLVKVGIFDHEGYTHSTVDVVDAIVHAFNHSPQIYIAESDNYKGSGAERLKIWKSLVSKRVSTFNLSEDADTRMVKVAGERIGLSHTVFKPNAFVSTHVLRSFDQGSIIKNLLGLVPDRRKARFHKNLETALLDIYEAIGGIDLAVLDGTYAYRGAGANPHARPEDTKYRVRGNVLVVGRDAVAVETVGAKLAGLDVHRVPVIRAAVERGLGVGDLSKIRIVGTSIDEVRKRLPKKL